MGIGHTRWATNGEPSDVNAHPHTSMDGKVAIIHNGIIENASQLRLDLQAEGYRFASATDTEVAAKLLGKIVDKIIADEGKPDLFKAVRRMAAMLEGAFTILATDCRQPDIVVGARHDSPLVVGLGEGENFLGSDVAAFVAYTKRAMEVDQDQAVCVSADKVIVADFNGNVVEKPEDLHRGLGCFGRRKGRLGFLYGQGDSRRPCRSAAHPAWPFRHEWRHHP